MVRGFTAIILTIVISMLTPVYTSAAMPYRGYTYDSWNVAVPSQIGFIPSACYDSQDFLTAEQRELKAPKDLFVTSDSIYILDSGNNRIVVLDLQFKLKKIIGSITRSGTESALNDPTGLFVDAKGSIYIADPGNNRVVKCDLDGRILLEITLAGEPIIRSDYVFKPTKVLVDGSGFIFVVAQGLYQGALVFDPLGKFKSFYGSNRVEVGFNLINDLFWKKFLSQEQIDKMAKYVPEEFTNFDIDSENFIYTCTQTSSVWTDRVKELNSMGVNILKANKGYGELNNLYLDGNLVSSQLVDINIDTNGFINVLDYTRGRIYQYENNGTLLFVFGGKGNQEGTFKAPAAIESVGSDILVLDTDKSSITVFEKTDFGAYVHKAVKAYNDGQYKEARAEWETILKIDRNYEIAYLGIGKALVGDGDFKSAEAYFKKGNNRDLSSEAFIEYRKQIVKKNFLLFFLGVVFLVTSFLVFKRIQGKKKKRLKQEFKEA